MRALLLEKENGMFESMTILWEAGMRQYPLAGTHSSGTEWRQCEPRQQRIEQLMKTRKEAKVERGGPLDPRLVWRPKEMHRTVVMNNHQAHASEM